MKNIFTRKNKLVIIIAAVVVIALIATAVFLIFGNNKNKGEKTENASTPQSQTENENTASEEETPAESSSAENDGTSVDTSDITEAEDISDAASLEELIEEFNDPNTTEERREELRVLLEDFFNMFEGEAITVE